MSVLIAGCGYVGTALGSELIRHGHVVYALRRSEAAALPAEFAPILADMCDPTALRNLPKGLETIVYCAAAGENSETAYRKAYVDGLINLLGAVREQGIDLRRIYYTSSTGVYHQHDGARIDESSPTEPRTFQGTVLLEAEDILLKSEFPATVVRLGGIYGPGRERLIDSVAQGRGVFSETPPRYTNRIHRDDAAGFLCHLIIHESIPKEPIYVLVDDEPAPRTEVHAWIATNLGVPTEDASGTENSSPSGGSNKRCLNRRARATGYEFRYPTYRDGYAPILAARTS